MTERIILAKDIHPGDTIVTDNLNLKVHGLDRAGRYVTILGTREGRLAKREYLAVDELIVRHL